jgi:hypothetical protein
LTCENRLDILSVFHADNQSSAAEGAVMPWEVTIRRADGAPLGDMATVRQQIVAALPAIRFERESSGQEKLAFARAKGIEFPEVLRQHFEQQLATERAEFYGDGFSIHLYGFEAQPLAAIHAEVRGDSNPAPVLASLCNPHDWVAVDDASGQPIDLAGSQASGWVAFRAYRDDAIRTIQASESGQ